jgi:hypothetical protein
VLAYFDMVMREESLKEASSWKSLSPGDVEDKPDQNLKQWKDDLWMEF